MNASDEGGSHGSDDLPKTLVLGELDPRLINRTGLLSMRLKAGKQSIKRLGAFFSAKAAAERAYARHMADWAAKEQEQGGSGVALDSSIAAAVQGLVTHAKNDA